MELNVWTSCEVTKADRDEANDSWAVTVHFSDGRDHNFKGIKHLIFATGLNGNQPNVLSYPGMVRPILTEFKLLISGSRILSKAKSFIRANIIWLPII